MSSFWAKQVDDAIDALLIKDPKMVEFTRRAVAKAMKVTPTSASQALMLHRRAQRSGATKHIAVSRGSGRGAIWLLLNGKGKKHRELTMGHAQHVANDLVRRARSDIACELEPGMMTHPIVQAVLVGMTTNIEQSVLTAARTIKAMTTVWEQTASEKADLRGVGAI
jgi:hypothetical protein